MRRPAKLVSFMRGVPDGATAVELDVRVVPGWRFGQAMPAAEVEARHGPQARIAGQAAGAASRRKRSTLAAAAA